MLPDLDIARVMGQRIIEDAHLYEVITIDRTVKERFLSRPWRPWVKWKTYHKPTAYLIAGRGLIAHPVIVQALREGRTKVAMIDVTRYRSLVDLFMRYWRWVMANYEYHYGVVFRKGEA